jgi:hypothetical protein
MNLNAIQSQVQMFNYRARLVVMLFASFDNMHCFRKKHVMGLTLCQCITDLIQTKQAARSLFHCCGKALLPCYSHTTFNLIQRTKVHI